MNIWRVSEEKWLPVGGGAPASAVAQVGGLFVSQVAEGDDELTGGLGAQAIGALAEHALLSPMVGDADLIFGQCEESEAGEDLTDGSEGEGRGSHWCRSFDSFNIHDFGGSDQMVCHLVDCLS